MTKIKKEYTPGRTFLCQIHITCFRSFGFFFTYQQLPMKKEVSHPLTAVLVLSWSVSLSWSMSLKLLVCEEAMFPPLKSPRTSFDAEDSPKLNILALWSVSEKLT